MSAPKPVALSWVRGTDADPPYINVGDALSPAVLTMVSGRPVAHEPFKSDAPRVAAIGTIAQNLRGGVVDIWGAGCSPWLNPLDPSMRRPYRRPADLNLRLCAVRGPMTEALLLDGEPRRRRIPYGDPGVLLPLFYAPQIEKRWDLGVILHLSELADRAFEARPKPVLARYRIPESLSGSVRLMTMVAPASVDGVRAKIDEMLACRRIVSTSLHGYALAAAYGIPTLYFGSDPGPNGMARAPLAIDDLSRLNPRFIDLIMGWGRRRTIYYRQKKSQETDWEAVMRAIDKHWTPPRIGVERLMGACPAGAAPLSSPIGGTIWDHPLIAATPILPPGLTGKLLGAMRRRIGGGGRG
jgi:pyruvyltransferase